MEHAKRKTIYTENVISALKRRGISSASNSTCLKWKAVFRFHVKCSTACFVVCFARNFRTALYGFSS